MTTNQTVLGGTADPLGNAAITMLGPMDTEFEKLVEDAFVNHTKAFEQLMTAVDTDDDMTLEGAKNIVKLVLRLLWYGLGKEQFTAWLNAELAEYSTFDL